MKEGRGRILITRSIDKKISQKSSVERILNHLHSISKKYGGEAADLRAEELMKIIDDPKNSEEDILKALEAMEQAEK